MAIFKIEMCKCGYRHNEPKPLKESQLCPKCGSRMRYLENWYMSYQILGKKYVQAVGPQKRLAEDALSKIKVDLREGRYFDKVAETSWNKAASMFREWFKTNVKPTTAEMYENSINHLTPYFQRLNLNKISPHMVEQYKAERSIGVTNSTVNRDLATIKRLFSLSVKWGLVEVDRVKSVSLLPENKARDRFLSTEEIEKLKTAIAESKSPYLQLAVLISLDTGLRRNGVMTLQWKEIDFKTGIIKKVTKGDKEVRIPLTARLKQILLAFKAKRKVLSPYVLCNEKGIPPQSLKTAFSTALKRAGIKDVRWHDLRRSFGSHFIMATKDLVALQNLLGHSDYNITKKHYAHLIDQHLKDAMDTFEERQSKG